MPEDRPDPHPRRDPTPTTPSPAAPRQHGSSPGGAPLRPCGLFGSVLMPVELPKRSCAFPLNREHAGPAGCIVESLTFRSRGTGGDMNVNEEQVKSERLGAVQRDEYDPAVVEDVIDSLEKAVDDLTARCAGMEQADMAMRALLQTANERVRLQEEELARALDAAREPAPEGRLALGVEDPVRATSEWAARLLEISTRDAEAIVAEARDEAGRVVAHARAEAAQIIQAKLSKLQAREEALDAMARGAAQGAGPDARGDPARARAPSGQPRRRGTPAERVRGPGPHAARLLLPRATGIPRAAHASSRSPSARTSASPGPVDLQISRKRSNHRGYRHHSAAAIIAMI